MLIYVEFIKLNLKCNEESKKGFPWKTEFMANEIKVCESHLALKTREEATIKSA